MTLTSENVKEIDRIYMRNGSKKDVVAKVAQQFGITEAFAGGLATALIEKRGPNVPDIVTESAPALTDPADSTPPAVGTADPYASRKAALAAKLQMEAEKAQAKPINECSLQEL